VFTGIAALVNYELNKVMYTSAAPMSLFTYSILTAMLPFLAFAIISFAVAALISRAIKSEADKKMETQKTETQAKQEAEFDKEALT